MTANMRTAAILTVALLTSACATEAPSQHYRLRGQDQNLEVNGELNKATRKVTIRINGAEALTGTLSWLSLEGDFRGTYRGHPVAATCHNVQKWLSSYVRCDVLIDNEKAASLVF
jgi:hypothetical protein